MTTISSRSCQTVGRFSLWWLWWACVSVWIDAGVTGLTVKFGVLLPEHPVARTMHPCVTLPIAMAEEWLIAEDLTPLNWIVDSPTSSRSSTRGWRTSNETIIVQFEYRNSQYSDTYGPIHAMEIYYRVANCRAEEDLKSSSVEPLEIQVFYGPCTKYALSPIAKYAEVWNVPVITPGGLTSRFNNEIDYVMLTRFVPPFEKVAEFVTSLLAKYDWWHVSFLFHNNVGADKVKGHPMCYDIKEAVVDKLIDGRDKRTAIDEPQVNVTTADSDEQEDKCCLLHQELFNENYYDSYDFSVFLDKIRKTSRGK